MNSYNGFSPNQRIKALNWLKKQWAMGIRKEKPKKCDICSQTEGYLAYHSEDYSEPYGEHIGAFGLCYTCHMVIHCRFRNKNMCDIYLNAIKDNKCYEPMTGNKWIHFRTSGLQNHFQTLNYTIVIKNNANLLEEIIQGKYQPN